MGLKDDMESDLDIFFDADDFAITGDYTSLVAGETVEVRLIVDFGQHKANDQVDSNTSSTQARVTIPRDDLPSPAKYGDLIDIDGVAWQVIKQLDGDSLVVNLEIRRELRKKWSK